MTESKFAPMESLKRHWFWPAAFAVALTNLAVVMVDGWQAPQLKEFGVLFDFALLIPCLYLVCYRANGKRAIVRSIALACLGIWAAGHIVPDGHHQLIDRVGFLRDVGLLVLIVIELRLAVEIYRIVFRSERDAVEAAVQKKADEENMPPWVARLLAAEARFWRRVLDFIRGPFQR